MDQLLCYAVCAMGSRYLEHRDDMERLYFERCLLLFEKLKTDEPTIASIQVTNKKGGLDKDMNLYLNFIYP